MSIVLGIEPTAATAFDTRNGMYASRRRAPYPRSLVNLSGLLRDPERLSFIAKGLGVEHYPVDQGLPIEMVIHDRLASDFGHEESIPARLPDYDGPVDYYEGVRYGESRFQTLRFLASHPDAKIVAIPAIFSGSRTEIVETARIVKSVNDRILVVVGGTYATADSHFLLETGVIDVVVIGEAILSFPALVHSFLQNGEIEKIPGIIYRGRAGQRVDNTKALGSYPPIHNYDQVPEPAWDRLDFRPYDVIGLTHLGETPAGQLVAPIDTEVGCGLKCKFCAAGVLNQGRLVKKSAKRILSEIQLLVDKHGRNMIHFDSDNPLVDNARSIELFSLLKNLNQRQRRNGDGLVRFAFPNGTAPWTFRDPALIPAMIEAGLFHISIAVEAGSARSLRRLGKSPAVPTFAYDAIKRIRHTEAQVKKQNDEKLIIEVFVMLGIPGETIEDLNDTVRFCERISQEFDVIIAPFYFAPLHGTPLFCDFFNENPKAKNLEWPVLGWLGTEKKDDARMNNAIRNSRTALYTFSRSLDTSRFVRL